jgi:hypothetical protein
MAWAGVWFHGASKSYIVSFSAGSTTRNIDPFLEGVHIEEGRVLGIVM